MTANIVGIDLGTTNSRSPFMSTGGHRCLAMSKAG